MIQFVTAMTWSSVRLICASILLSYLALSDVIPSATVAVTHWRLTHADNVEPVDSHLNYLKRVDPIFGVLVDSLPTNEPKGIVKTQPRQGETTTMYFEKDAGSEFDGEFRRLPAKREATNASAWNAIQVQSQEDAVLSCGAFANVTSIDHLEGIKKRSSLGYVPEPELELLFIQKATETPNFRTVEQNLIQAVKERENIPVLFNLVGNLLRLQGNVYYAIECYRNILQQSPYNADALMNVARIMMKVNHYSDALHIVQKSMEAESHSVWLQYFFLGQIYAKLDDKEKAIANLEIAYQKNPSFLPAMQQLKKLKDNNSIDRGNILMVTIALILLVIAYIIHWRSASGIDWKWGGFLFSICSFSSRLKELH